MGKGTTTLAPASYNTFMHRFRALLLLAALLLPQLALAQSGLPLLDPSWHIVPDPHELDPSCPVGSPLGIGGVIVLLQNLMNAAVALGVVVLTLMIAYAGFMFVTSPFNSENRTKAKTSLWNTVVGIVIVLVAWLAVDFVMKALYNPEATFGGRSLGPWNEVLVGGDACIIATSTSPLFRLPFTTGGPRTNPDAGVDTLGIALPRTGPGACNANTLKAAATQGGTALSDSDARVFACIARWESSCGTKVLNYNWGKGSSAAGPFQVLLDGNSACYETAACRTAAGVSGSLNCSAAFSGGNPTGDKAHVERCVKAAANLSCSISAAVCVKQKQGFNAWTADKNSRKQAACFGG